ncbi:MAG: cysteine--tRNA ligase, partial [Pseudomonadota bacterium]|nr:cysteine--tRNA ligase [Pseudomonadota bacterium]
MRKLFIFNSLTNKKEVFVPIDKSNIRVYACGPTVYNYAHIGNARMSVVFDTIVKLLRYAYPKVTYVSNIKYIDDKIIKRSLQEKKTCDEISNTYLKIYNYEMEKLNVNIPDHQPRATEYVDSMIKKIGALLEEGYAYLNDKHVLFSVNNFPRYGALSKRIKKEQIAGIRVDKASYKKNSEDFVLWKPSKKNEPGWNSPWGTGRPGWHTECFAMASDLLKTPFDIHGGGLDLKFPHHDNEIAQGCCFNNKKNDIQSYAKYWMHNGFVTFQNNKMSKSLGNIILLKDYLEKYNGEIIRLALLTSHYRSPLVWSESLITQSKNILDKFYNLLRQLQELDVEVTEKKLPGELEECLFDDLNIAKVLAYLNSIAKDKKSFINNKSKKNLKTTLL